MVRIWGGRVARWGVLGLTALILVLYFGNLFLTLERRVKTDDKALAASRTALAVANSKIAERDQALGNLHVTVTQPPAQVTVTVTPMPGQTSVTTNGGSSRVVTVPIPFAVPGQTATAKPSPLPTPVVTVTNCPVLHLLFLCL